MCPVRERNSNFRAKQYSLSTPARGFGSTVGIHLGRHSTWSSLVGETGDIVT